MSSGIEVRLVGSAEVATSKMEWPKQIVMLGAGREAEAIGQVLSLLRVQCHRHELAVADAAAPPTLPEHLARSYLVVALADEQTAPPQMVRVVCRLRSDRGLNWAGAFLAIVRQRADQERLAALDLLGDARGLALFGQQIGHALLARPLAMTDLLRAVSQLEEMGPNDWRALHQRSGVANLLVEVQRGEEARGRADLEQARQIVGRIAETVEQIDWSSLVLDGHRDAKLAEELTVSHRAVAVRDLADCGVFLNRVRELMARTSLGDLW